MIPPSIIHLWGGVASAKSSVAASFPGKIAWMSFDIGGFQRARVPEGTEIVLYEYPAPIKLEMTKKRVELEGWKELWGQFLTDLMKSISDPEVKTIVIDTATRCWLACHRAYLQVKQEKQRVEGKEVAEGLIQIEYGEVNPWMFEVLEAPKMQGKHLILTSHDEEERMDQVIKGQKESVIVTDVNGKPVMKAQGFRHLRKNVDMELHMVPEDGNALGIVTKSGLVTLALDGARIKNPVYKRLEEVLAMAATLEEAGMEVPREW